MPIGSSKNCLLQRSSEELSFFRSSCSSKSICASQISKIRNFCTIRKFKFLSKNSISTKPQHFTSFSPQFFWQFFSLNQSYQQPKSPKPQHFHEFFSPKKKSTFFREIIVEFLNKNEDFEQCVLHFFWSMMNFQNRYIFVVPKN